VTELHKGELVGGRYRLEDRIGEGGMASVWRAKDETLDRPVAVKFLHAGYKGAADSVGRREEKADGFLREARIAAAVRHRNVVAILDFGTQQDGTPFMVMEFLEGESLEDRLVRGERLSQPEALRMAIRVLHGLAEVHAAGIVHRDLKPANIFLVRDRGGFFPKLLDFGISRSLDSESGRRSALTTRDGHIVGTLQYMSSEQARGLTDIDKRTDIYSMGVMLYELLTGRLPFDSPHQGDLLVQICTSTPPTVLELAPEVGKPLSDAVERAMQREREKRFADAEQMQRALMEIADQDRSVRGGTLAMSVPPPASRPVRAASGGEERAGDTVQAAAGGTVQMWSPEQGQTPLSGTVEAERPADGEPGPEQPDVGLVDTVSVSPVGGKRAWALRAAAATGVLLLGGAALAVALAWPRARESEPGPRYIVVKGGADTAEAEPPGEPEADIASKVPDRAPNAEEQAPAAGRSPTAGTVRPSAGRDRERKPPGGQPGRKAGGDSLEARLGRAFVGQKQGVERCFREYAAGQKQAPRLSVRLELQADGSVGGARVIPEQLAATDLGKCLQQACRSMKFRPQKEGVSFTIPLTARLER
jgi:hypothetical protein